MTDPLRRALDDLAGEVRMVDLRDRALATSRRVTRRRRLWASITTSGAVIAVISAAVLLWPRHDNTPPPVGPTDQPTTSSPTVSSSPTMTTPLTYLPGTAIYLRTDGDQLQVVRIIAGQPPTTTTIGTVDSEEKMTSTLSPDGVTIAFETRCDLPGPGDLVIDRSTGSTRRTVASSVLCVGGPHPIWLADSASLRVCRDAGDCGRLDVATGTYTPLGHDAGWGEYVAFSPGGAFRARRVNARFVVETPAGVEVGYVPIPPNLVPVEGRCIQALSADGHYLAFGPCNTDFSIHRDVRWVDDTYTKEPVSLATLLGRSPADGEELDGLSFLADGGAVVATVTNQVFRWYLLSSIGVVTAIVDDAPGRILTGQFVYLP